MEGRTTIPLVVDIVPARGARVPIMGARASRRSVLLRPGHENLGRELDVLALRLIGGFLMEAAEKVKGGLVWFECRHLSCRGVLDPAQEP